MLHGRGRDVDAGDAGGARGEECAAVALAAGDVEHIESGDERRGEMVPMPMLMPDLAGGAGDEALAGEFEFMAHWMTFAQFYPWPPPPSSARMSGLPTSRAFTSLAPPRCQRRPPASLQDASGRIHC